MLPNVCPGAGEEPAYNTADAALWFFEAWRAYLDATDDVEALRDVYPVLAGMMDWHFRGTRYGIGADAGDGLLRAGVPGVQLTWMDARVDGQVVTPRIGKPVEINALWFNALAIMSAFAGRLGKRTSTPLPPNGCAGASAGSCGPTALASTTSSMVRTAGFQHPAEPDLRREPEAFASRSSGAGSRGDRMRAPPPHVVRTALPGAREPGLPSGLWRQRRGAGWRISSGTRLGLAARALCAGLSSGDRRCRWGAGSPVSDGDALADQGIGTLGEIFDGDPPHHPRGAPSQAWSVACTLDAWRQLRKALETSPSASRQSSQSTKAEV